MEHVTLIGRYYKRGVVNRPSCDKETPSNAQCWISLGQTVEENTVTTLSLDIVRVQPSALC